MTPRVSWTSQLSLISSPARVCQITCHEAPRFEQVTSLAAPGATVTRWLCGLALRHLPHPFFNLAPRDGGKRSCLIISLREPMRLTDMGMGSVRSLERREQPCHLIMGSTTFKPRLAGSRRAFVPSIGPGLMRLILAHSQAV